jgi:hypothetical protein
MRADDRDAADGLIGGVAGDQQGPRGRRRLAGQCREFSVDLLEGEIDVERPPRRRA